MSRNYEWDTDKQRENLDKHGVDFADIPNFDWEGATTLRSDRAGELNSSPTVRSKQGCMRLFLSSAGAYRELSASAEPTAEK